MSQNRIVFSSIFVMAFFLKVSASTAGENANGLSYQHGSPNSMNGIKVKSISSGFYHCNVLAEDGQVYTWGRGLYGVLGNGSNHHSLVPVVND